MTLPAQVRDSAEKARKAQQEAMGTPPTDPPVSDPPDKPKEPASAPPAPTPPAIDWEQRYKTLQGMFNSQLPAAQSKIKSLEQRLEELESAAVTPPPAAPSAVQHLLTDKDVEDFGEETLDVMRRAARQEAQQAYGPVIQQLQSQLASLTTNVVPKVQQMETAHQATAQQTFFDSLTSLVPDWQTINSDARFHDWLLAPDALTRRSKQTFLEEAQRSSDAHGVAQFFVQWKRENGTTPPPPPPVNPGMDPALTSLIAPGNGRGGQPPADKPPVTREFIAQFYDDIRRGKYASRPEEKAKTEAAIFAAQREGRVT